MTHYFIQLQSKLKAQLVKLFISYKTRKNTVIIKCNLTYCKASMATIGLLLQHIGQI